jgi:hypothetical protein
LIGNQHRPDPHNGKESRARIGPVLACALDRDGNQDQDQKRMVKGFAKKTASQSPCPIVFCPTPLSTAFRGINARETTAHYSTVPLTAAARSAKMNIKYNYRLKRVTISKKGGRNIGECKTAERWVCR